MKTNSTLLKGYSLMLLALVLIGLKSYSQPEYYFLNSSLESGFDKEVGAQYRFPSVKPGFDALVTIDFISPDIKIVDFDDNKNGGFDEAFQPRLMAKSWTKGYAEFTISFVLAGTNKPAQMAEVPATSIDVDGSKRPTEYLSEFDEYFTPGDHQVDFDMMGTDLDISFGAGSVTGRNREGKEKTLIDTLAKEAMFGVIYSKITSFTVRIGLDNQQNGATTRQRSVYFQRFFFANSFLPIKNLTSFAGTRKNDNSVVLNWTMNTGHDYTTAIVEKSLNGSGFTAIGETAMSNKTFANFTDNSGVAASVYYRLKMIEKSGKISYSSVLFIRGNAAAKLAIYPSIATENANISYQTTKAGPVTVNLFDLNGRIVMKKSMNTEAGLNTISLNGLSALSAGQYVVVVRSAESTNTQRIQVTK